MKNIKITIRHLLGQKLSTSFVLISFTIAFCCCILVYLFVKDEFAFDKYNTNFNNIYRLNIQAKDKSSINCSFPGVFYEKMANISGVKKLARLQTFLGDRFVYINKTIYTETSFLFGDPEILDILKFDFLIGNPNEALAKPFNVIISQSIAKKYFGDENPLGKTINEDYHDFTVTGVVKDLPKQSHITMNFLASISSYNFINKDLLTKWYITAFSYYFILPANTNIKTVENQLAKSFAEGNGISVDKTDFEMYLEPLGDIHLKSAKTLWDNAIKGDSKVVYGLIAIALLILGIAIANYINSITADFRRKAKENSIRSVIGAPKYATIIDQVTETFILLSISIVLATIFSFMLLPIINNLSGKLLSFDISVFKINLALLLSTTLISVIYPITFLNSLNTANTLKNQVSILKPKVQKNQQLVRGSLVTFQLIIATILIISTIVINKQLQLVMKTKVGFDKENTLIVDNPYTEGMDKRYDLFKEKLLVLPMVKSVGVTQNAPGGYINNYSPAWLPDQTDQKINIGQITIDHDFLNTIGAKFIDGRDFNTNISANETSKIVINRSAVEALKLINPVGHKIIVLNNAYTPNNELEVIGVIEDMQYFTLKESAKPVMYYIRDWGKQNIIIKLGKGDYTTTMAKIKNSWKEVEPVWPFNFEFMDDRISTNYKSDINTAKIISCLSGIAIFLSVLGILGMIIYTIQQRIKEIGIRKVNGAKISEILIMLYKDFIIWVTIAFVIATPLAWYIMHNWLKGFAYKTTLNWWIFALSGLLALSIALLTVSWQCWRAASRNPVESLRYE
jgi:putative ABC transport system permease protein